MRKINNILVGILCLMMLMPTVVLAANNNKPEDWGDVRIDNEAIIKPGKAGKEVKFTLPIVNLGTTSAVNVIVSPVRDSDPAVYPFTTTKANEYTEYGNIEAKGTVDANGVRKDRVEKEMTFNVRKDVLTKDYALQFNIEYYIDGVQKVSLTRKVFIEIKGPDPTATPKPTKTPKPKATPTEAPDPDDNDPGDPGDNESYDPGDTSSPGGGSDDGEEKKTGTPRVIVEGFRTEPKVVNAGSSFKLILEIRNTSKKTTVNNMEINLQAADAADNTSEDGGVGSASDTFLPDKGSNTLYVDTIAADSTKEISIDLTARADLQQQPYSIGIAMKYEDSKAEQFDASSEISIPVNQKARFELSQVEVSPENLEVGGEGNVTFSIYNLGRTKLYNVKVQLVDDTIADGEAFVGNLEAGATGEVDLMVTGAAETTDDGTVEIQITYEDKEGNANNYQGSCTIFVVPATDQGMMPPDEAMMMPEEDASGGLGILAKIGIGVGVVAAVAAGIFVIIKHKRKKEEDFADEFLGSDKDEQ